ncbi:26S proteasome non-ATPase regulatory subunit 10-like [Phymastichus coffea]|uniref:26S proteasome non-ATPase regulatory subunit 10-like n=1 Tax=Phymastichus coffea TaxID=108790 RepID=UPI00273CA5A2|nr:26S proteasome non-ATPase regulatory subunit 10-like [Phymastichus coffea]
MLFSLEAQNVQRDVFQSSSVRAASRRHAQGRDILIIKIPNMAKELISRYGAKPYDMAYRGHLSTLKALLSQDEKLKDRADENGRTLMHWAALGGHEDVVGHLLSLGVAVGPRDDTGMTPLILAASAGREKVVNMLLKDGANVNEKSEGGHSALQYAASKNWKPICANLLDKKANVNIADNWGATPLHRAASKGNIEIVRLLIENGEHLDIDKKDRYGNTALHLACEEDRQDEAKLLVHNGANLEIQNKEKKTPLDLCSMDLAKELLKIAHNRNK